MKGPVRQIPQELLGEFTKGQRKSLMQVEKMVSENGARTFDDLDEVIKFLKEL